MKRGAKFAPDEASRASQADHLARLKAIDFYPAKPFANADNLVARVFGSVVLGALKKAGSVTKPAICPSHRSAACSPAAMRTLPT
jgi:hypothetical protein